MATAHAQWLDTEAWQGWNTDCTVSDVEPIDTVRTDGKPERKGMNRATQARIAPVRSPQTAQKQAELGLAEAKEKQKEKEETERQEFLRMLRETRQQEEASSLKYLENQVRELRRKAVAAEERERFDRAIVLYERILTLNPDDEDAKARLASAQKKRHVYRSQEVLQQALNHYEVAIVSLEESSVVYQQIFRYPDAKEWARVAAKVPDIASEVGKGTRVMIARWK